MQLFVFYIHNAFSFSDISYAHCNSLILPLVSYCSFCHMNSFFLLVARAFMERREGCFATQNNCRFQVLKYRFVSAFPGFLSGGRIQLASLSTSIFCATSVHVWCYALNVIIVFFHSNLAGEKNWLGAPCVRFFSCLFFKWISVIDILSYYDFFLKGIKILMYPSSHLPGDIYYKCIGL